MLIYIQKVVPGKYYTTALKDLISTVQLGLSCNTGFTVVSPEPLKIIKMTIIVTKTKTHRERRTYLPHQQRHINGLDVPGRVGTRNGLDFPGRERKVMRHREVRWTAQGEGAGQQSNQDKNEHSWFPIQCSSCSECTASEMSNTLCKNIGSLCWGRKDLVSS